MMRAIAFAALLAGVLGTQNVELRTQNPEPATRNPLPVTVSGRVVADDAGEPIVNARVRVTAAGGPGPLAVTGGSGEFTVAAPPGPLTIAVARSGYIAKQTTIVDRARPIEIRLQRAGVISGRVADRLGEPVVGASVFAQAAPSGAASRILARTETDDRGEYRLAGLSAGGFTVFVFTAGATATAVSSPGGGAIYSTQPTRTYFPAATSSADADVVEVRAGEEHPSIDFAVDTDQTGAGAGYITFAGPVKQTAGPVAGASGAIRGRVSVEGRALSGATVRLIGSGSPVPLRGTRSDGLGRFAFESVPPGKFRVAAAKPGYAPAKAAEAVFPSFPLFGGGPEVDLHEDEARDDVDVELARLGSLTGVVSDEIGEPLQGASVQLLQVRYERGRRRLAPAATARLTDDRGVYRIFDVPPGQYLVAASIGGVTGADLPGYGRSYFPGSDDPQAAQFLSIGTSQDLTGIDFSLRPARTARLVGKILGPSGEPAASGTVQLRPDPGAGEIAALPIGARTEGDGTFEFPNVPPGRYLIYVDHGRSRSSVEGDFAVLPVAVNGTDVADVAIQISPGSTIAGRITFDTADRTHLPPSSGVDVAPVAVDGDLAPANVADAEIRADGSFTMQGIRGVRRIETTRLPAGWTLREVRVNGIDATDRPLTFGRGEESLSDVEVILTDQVNDLSGSVEVDRGQPASGAHVVVFSTDRDRRYAASRFVRDATTGADGAFDVSGLPAGSYYVAVAGRPPLGGDEAWRDPAFLESLVPDAETVTLGGGRKQTVKMKTAAR